LEVAIPAAGWRMKTESETAIAQATYDERCPPKPPK